MLAEAKHIGEKAKSGEVFIFHVRPERKILWLFPKKDRHFYHYKKGVLQNKMAYSPSPTFEIFATESQLLQQYKSSENPNGKSIFLYFGHEIPYSGGDRYYRSIPEQRMNTKTFSEGVSRLISGSGGSFDLTVLSTCNNGSPDMVHALQPYTQTLLASPQNLHLSHIDTGQLLVLEERPNLQSAKLANLLAEQTYERLSNSIQTVISLAVYDMQVVNDYISKVDSSYSSYVADDSLSVSGTDNTDCTSVPVFSSKIDFSKGVTVWYRSPEFGTKAKRTTHSGWGCKNKEL